MNISEKQMRMHLQNRVATSSDNIVSNYYTHCDYDYTPANWIFLTKTSILPTMEENY